MGSDLFSRQQSWAMGGAVIPTQQMTRDGIQIDADSGFGED